LILKINATKNMNAGAIIATPKRQLLAQKCHMTYRSLRSVTCFFAQLTVLPSPPKSYASRCFSVSRPPEKYPFLWEHLLHPMFLDHLTQHSKQHLDQLSRFCIAHSRESLYLAMCAKTQLMCDCKN